MFPKVAYDFVIYLKYQHWLQLNFLYLSKIVKRIIQSIHNVDVIHIMLRLLNLETIVFTEQKHYLLVSLVVLCLSEDLHLQNGNQHLQTFDLQADTLFLTDPAQSFYLQDSTYSWQGLKYYRSLIQKYIKLYKRVILIGASMGASMVCMCSDLATLSIAFNPILDPSLAPTVFHYRTLQRYPQPIICKQVQTNIDKIMSESQQSILHVHWSKKSPSDIAQSKLVSNQNTIYFTDEDKCNKSKGVYFWLHNCNTHNLPQDLKRRGILTQILQHHLNALAWY